MVKQLFYILVISKLLFPSFSPDSTSNIFEKSVNRLDSLHINPSEFLYAGEERASLDGELPLRKTNIRPIPMLIFGGAGLGSMVAIHINQRNAWWSKDRGSFHFQEDWASALQVDKFGHAYGTYMFAYAFSEILQTSGLSRDDAVLYGSIAGGVYQTYVETEDGFGNTWGFSPSDWYFDMFGAGFFLAQHYIPDLQNFTPKWEYASTEWINRPTISRPKSFMDDYNSSTFWISVNVHNLLPQTAKKYWPNWLFFAIGYGGDAIDAKQDTLTQKRICLSLDISLRNILPKLSGNLDWWVQTLDLFKFPTPTLEFRNGKSRLYLLYPFRFNIGRVNF